MPHTLVPCTHTRGACTPPPELPHTHTRTGAHAHSTWLSAPTQSSLGKLSSFQLLPRLLPSVLPPPPTSKPCDLRDGRDGASHHLSAWKLFPWVWVLPQHPPFLSCVSPAAPPHLYVLLCLSLHLSHPESSCATLWSLRVGSCPSSLPGDLTDADGGRGTSRGTRGPEPPQLLWFQSRLPDEGSAVCLTPWRPVSWQHSPGGHSLLRGPQSSLGGAAKRPEEVALCWCPALAAMPTSSSRHPQITPSRPAPLALQGPGPQVPGPSGGTPSSKCTAELGDPEGSLGGLSTGEGAGACPGDPALPDKLDSEASVHCCPLPPSSVVTGRRGSAQLPSSRLGLCQSLVVAATRMKCGC